MTASGPTSSAACRIGGSAAGRTASMRAVTRASAALNDATIPFSSRAFVASSSLVESERTSIRPSRAGCQRACVVMRATSVRRVSVLLRKSLE